jgi:perosamine synthetase
VDRDRVQTALARRGIASGRYFAPIHMQPAWQAHPSAGTVSLALTESIARRTLALPFFNRIAWNQQEEVARALEDAIQSAERHAAR